MHPLLEDPYVAGMIDEAIDRRRGHLTPEEIEDFREVSAFMLANNPIARKALERSRPPVVDESGDHVKEGASLPGHVVAVDRQTGTGGRRGR